MRTIIVFLESRFNFFTTNQKYLIESVRAQGQKWAMIVANKWVFTVQEKSLFFKHWFELQT